MGYPIVRVLRLFTVRTTELINAITMITVHIGSFRLLASITFKFVMEKQTAILMSTSSTVPMMLLFIFKELTFHRTLTLFISMPPIVQQWI
jgi:hypothetical protein